MHPAAPGMKWCGGCEAEKPLAAFARNRTMTDGLQAQCRPCQAENLKHSRAKHKARFPEKHRALAFGGLNAEQKHRIY